MGSRAVRTWPLKSVFDSSYTAYKNLNDNALIKIVSIRPSEEYRYLVIQVHYFSLTAHATDNGARFKQSKKNFFLFFFFSTILSSPHWQCSVYLCVIFHVVAWHVLCLSKKKSVPDVNNPKRSLLICTRVPRLWCLSGYLLTYTSLDHH